jgi:hypothetical protein
MEYTINSSNQIENTVITNVTITLDDASQMTLDIAHFMPQSVDDIKNGIVNRAISEQAKIDSINNIQNIINQLPIDQTFNIN